MGAVHQIFVFPMLFPFLPFIVLWHEFVFHKSVELGEEDIGEDRAEDAALRYAGKRFVAFPILHVSCIEELLNKIEKSSVLDVLSKCRDDEIMIEAAERSYNTIPYSRTQKKTTQPRSK